MLCVIFFWSVSLNGINDKLIPGDCTFLGSNLIQNITEGTAFLCKGQQKTSLGPEE